MKRYLMVYDKKDDSLVEEYKLENIDKNELIDIFGRQENDPDMIYVYDIREEHKHKIEAYINQKIELSRFDYQLTSYVD